MSLAIVEMRTKLGVSYVFPDMDRIEVYKLLHGIHGGTGVTQFMMVNASQAVLSVPLRIIATIIVDGEERWACPACTATKM